MTSTSPSLTLSDINNINDIIRAANVGSELFKTGFAAESGQIRKNRTFSNLQGLNLCTSHILVFGCLHGQDVVGS